MSKCGKAGRNAGPMRRQAGLGLPGNVSRPKTGSELMDAALEPSHYKTPKNRLPNASADRWREHAQTSSPAPQPEKLNYASMDSSSPPPALPRKSVAKKAAAPSKKHKARVPTPRTEEKKVPQKHAGHSQSSSSGGSDSSSSSSGSDSGSTSGSSSGRTRSGNSSSDSDNSGDEDDTRYAHAPMYCATQACVYSRSYKRSMSFVWPLKTHMYIAWMCTNVGFERIANSCVSIPT